MCTLRKIDNFTEKIRDHILEYPDAYNIPDTTNRDFHLTPEYTLYEVLDSNNNVIGFVLLLLTQKNIFFIMKNMK